MCAQIKPSREWTGEERLKLIAEIAKALGLSLQNRVLPRQMDALARIVFLAEASEGFLEANRDEILTSWPWRSD